MSAAPDPNQSYFHAGMDAGLSETGQAGGDFSLFSLSFTANGTTFSGGTEGDQQSSSMRHRTNEWVVTPDRPSFAYDSLLAFQSDQDVELDGNGNVVNVTTRSQTGIRLMDDGVFTGDFPLDRALALLPSLDELFRARVFTTADLDGDGIAESSVWAQLDSLVRVPVPGTGLFLLGLAGLFLRRR